MKVVYTLVFLLSVLISCKKNPDTNPRSLAEEVDGFYKIVSATTDTKVDIDGNSSMENLFKEIPELQSSTIDVIVNSKVSQYHLLWPEQEIRESILQSYSLVGRINQFTIDKNRKVHLPTSNDTSSILAAPVDMAILEENIISCRMIRELTTPKGKVLITIVAKYQKDLKIQRN
ncbi:MAG: hypothetical protein WKF66_16415 [Pedobacter sp.]